MSKSKLIATLFGAAFLGAGLLGFIPNPIVGDGALFHTNAVHNLVHLLTGAAFFIGVFALDRAKLTLQAIGLAYVGVTILGFLTPGDMLLGIVHINTADKFLHLFLAVPITAAGFGIREEAADGAVEVQSA